MSNFNLDWKSKQLEVQAPLGIRPNIKTNLQEYEMNFPNFDYFIFRMSFRRQIPDMIPDMMNDQTLCPTNCRLIVGHIQHID